MIIVDTNIVAEFMKEHPADGVRKWMLRLQPDELRLCAPVVMETVFGTSRIALRSGSSKLSDAFARVMADVFLDRVLPFDKDCAVLAGSLKAKRERQGRPISEGDQMIAAICLHHGATLATRNVKDFEGLDLKLVNPFEAV